MIEWIERIVSVSITVFGFGFLGWFMRQEFVKIHRRMDRTEERYHLCREELPGKYASKGEMCLLKDRVLECAEYIAYTKGVSNGKNNTK
jgi:hypothetical protein